MTNPIGRVNGKYATAPGNKPTAPSVTSVVGVLDKPGLPWGAAKETALFAIHHRDEWEHLPPDEAYHRLRKHHRGVWDDKRDRGSLIHDLAEQWAAGQEIDCPPDCVLYMDALERFWDDWQPEWLHVERTVVYDHPDLGYGGTFDAIARLGDGATRLLDIKTGERLWPEVRWQLAAYRFAQGMAVFDEIGQFTGTEPVPSVDGCAVLHLKDDGTYELVEVEAGRAEFDEFLHLRRAWTAAQRSKRFEKAVGRRLVVPQPEGAA